ncbi:MAG: hypothetical protein M1510_08160 [Nitrospirae bacterium]|nr:hypothetical protein [Nitrospirota bacterium]
MVFFINTTSSERLLVSQEPEQVQEPELHQASAQELEPEQVQGASAGFCSSAFLQPTAKVNATTSNKESIKAKTFFTISHLLPKTYYRIR